MPVVMLSSILPALLSITVMPSALASVDSAQSTQAEENLSCSENLENADGDSQDDCGSSDFDSDSDDLKEVIPNETSVQEKPSLLGKSGFVGAGVETDDKFRVKFDSELKKYKDAKMRFLLSLVHDNKPTTSGDDGNTLDKVYSLFGNEIIILRALDNVDNKLKNGTSKEKKKRDRSQRVKSRSRTSSRETALEVPSDTDRSRTQSENDQYLPASGEEPALPAAAETEVQSFSQTVLQHEQISTQDVHASGWQYWEVYAFHLHRGHQFGGLSHPFQHCHPAADNSWMASSSGQLHHLPLNTYHDRGGSTGKSTPSTYQEAISLEDSGVQTLEVRSPITVFRLSWVSLFSANQWRLGLRGVADMMTRF
ncbi:hypothetical protein GE061_007878 [Apolygus lucorum]|uniref:Uncharacterized protein n=1 Tax=Apolygus lucorum TaxID=248454 RepID=A0A8S9WPR9_APOLU|nr:hypothetical protein GE061_007878 [Apolygus lucorum]